MPRLGHLLKLLGKPYTLKMTSRERFRTLKATKFGFDTHQPPFLSKFPPGTSALAYSVSARATGATGPSRSMSSSYPLMTLPLPSAGAEPAGLFREPRAGGLVPARATLFLTCSAAGGVSLLKAVIENRDARFWGIETTLENILFATPLLSTISPCG